MKEAFNKTIDNINFVSVTEAINLPLDHTYDLHGLTVYEARNSLYSLDENDRRCGKEPKDVCKTKKYIDILVKKCNCLPFKLRFLVGEV